MCGIAGFTRFHSPIGNEATLKKMGLAITHRGPDASGEYLDDYVGLSHRRLSIIDLSESGTQPMHSADNRYVISFNGEIYNFLTLRAELEKQGYPFQTHTDTEVILALYQTEGQSMVSKLNGMFAFAIWDKNDRTLFLARDRVGKKPLYYLYDGKNFIFASEIKSILQIPEVKKDLRYDAVYDFFEYQYVPDPKTIFNNIFKLQPGHWMQVDADGIKSGEYWDISFADVSTKSEAQLSSELMDIIRACTHRRMISDVPLGAFLSGGIDSSGVVGLMAEKDSKPVTTCSIGFDVKKYDEIDFARIVAKKFHTDHHEFVVQDTVQDNLEKIVAYFDEPFADQSLVPTFFVSELARQKVTVALAGDGGDEVFAGYEKYSVDRIENNLRRLFPGFLRHSLFPGLSRLFSNRDNRLLRKAGSLLSSLSMDSGKGFYVSNSHFGDALWNQMITDDTRRAIGDYHPAAITEDFYNKADTDNHVSKILYTDTKTFLPGDILVKVDRMSMANSLEVRAPLLDYELIEFAAKIPASLKLNKGEKKYILKNCFKPILPDDILYRKKMGFSVPLAHWLRHEIKTIAEKSLFQSNGGVSDLFKMDVVEEVWHRHQKKQVDYSNQLWSLLMFQLWWNRYMNAAIV